MRMPKIYQSLHLKCTPRLFEALEYVAAHGPLVLVALVALATSLAGCAVGPDFAAPAAPEAAAFTEKPVPTRTVSADTTAGAAQKLWAGRDIQGDWWALFHSPQINALVERALKANPTLAAAQASLREARENTRAQQGTFFPQLSASTSGERERNALHGSVPSTYNVISGSLSVSYTIDAFGGVRRQVEQLNAQAEYQRFELEATELTLIANVVNAAINEASLQAQIDTTHDIIRAYAAALDINRRRFELGGVSQVDVLQQQSLLDAQTATLPGLQKQLEQQRNQLAVYLGGLPSDYTAPTLDLANLVLPEDLPVSLPSSLVAQRPDIQAYSALLHSATASVGIAVANMLPQISLTGSYGRDGNNFSNLFNPAGIVWSIAASLTQPVFEGGTLKARKRAADAAVDVAAAQYSSTVNSAFQDVANALVAIHRDAETLAANLAAQKTAAASLKVSEAQYRAGGGTYLNVLSAEQSDESARLKLISSQATRYTDTVALFQALGGGWWHRNDVDPKVAQCCGVL
ncbi:efflux transporter, outer membrane factor (OMF) lipo, NodT family protein [Burkholderia gladioli]|uniref:Efflux transporter, outer membrane factor (OMF) lipo, NodT family protein n=2 Tax=Burkholderia gladioli TaxID=28095 RepID=A0AAW3EVC4_BURGA|nr:efflux transporter, outer membrane factor (OMF) lipo, NodT family protein [Burkholderia gladioli]KGC11723.1 efflux transporter, outer membrane factor (OMF) lipo, NodT family protein [Burkholderia gladioli]